MFSGVETVIYLRDRDNVCDWDIPFMPAHTVLQNFKPYRNQRNKTNLSQCLSATDIVSTSYLGRNWYHCNEHRI